MRFLLIDLDFENYGLARIVLGGQVKREVLTFHAFVQVFVAFKPIYRIIAIGSVVKSARVGKVKILVATDGGEC